MTTDLNALRTETHELARYARERQEDAIVFHAVRLFLDEVAAVPGQAFGEIPEHSDRYRRDWGRIRTARNTETVTARDELWYMSGALMQVAADYENTDLELSYEFEVGDSNIEAYLRSMNPPGGNNPYRPGDPPGGRAFPNWAPFGARAGELPGQDDFNKVGSEPLPSVRELPPDREYRVTWKTNPEWWKPGGDAGPRGEYVEIPRIDAQPGLENDHLYQFVSEHGPFLIQLEGILEQLGLTIKDWPWKTVVRPVFLSSPKIIRSRSLLLGRGANPVRAVYSSMKNASDNLRYYWNSPGGTIAAASGTFFSYSDALLEYTDHVGDAAEWWSKQGVQLASVLEGLRNAYADAGYKRINELYRAMQAYNDSLGKAFGACRNPEEKLVDALVSFANTLIVAGTLQYTMLQDLLKAEDQRRREEGTLDIGSLIYGEPTPFPRDRSVPAGWADSGGWAPKATAPPTVSGSS